MSRNETNYVSKATSSHQEENQASNNGTDSVGGNGGRYYRLRLIFPNFGHDCESHLVEERDDFNLLSS
jgi:hypothetical protein